MSRQITIGDGQVRLDNGGTVLKTKGMFVVRPLKHGVELVERAPPELCRPRRFVLHTHDGKRACMITEPAPAEKFDNDSEEFWFGAKSGSHHLFEPMLNLPWLRRAAGL